MEDTTEALLANEGGADWTAEILEAVEARKQAEEILKQHPRPKPPRGKMQRSSSSTQTKAPFTTHNTLTGINAKR